MEPLWKECISWLDKFKVIPSGNPALSPGAGPRDLVLLLRDGVVLCQLVHCLDPQSVDMTQVNLFLSVKLSQYLFSRGKKLSFTVWKPLALA